MKTAVRRVLLMSALLSPTALQALGLGEIRLNSALNQPFDAEIELVSAAAEDLAALRASLASNDTFARYGLDRPSYLSEFSFRVVRGADGRDVLRVTSPKPVTEPFVTLLVEANWPRGRLLREYTVLLDPPVFAPAAEAPEPAVATPRAVTPAPVARAEPVEAAPARTEARPARPAPATVAAATIEPGSSYRVQRNDTLWRIASGANPGSRSDVNRAMVAIYQSNPEAFGGNINVLRAGSLLRIPAQGEIAAIPAADAAAEVARQYRLWREGTSSAEAGADSGRLRLVTPEQGTAAASTATAPAAAAPAGAESAAIQSRVEQLERELAEARRLLEVRNAELATLQGQAPAPAAEESAVAAPAEVPPVAEAPAGEAPAEAAPAAPPAPVAEQPAAEPEPAVEAPAPKPETGPSLWERLSLYWWIALGLIAAVLALVLVRRSRRAGGAAHEHLEETLGRPGTSDLRARPPAVAPRPREADILVEERRPAEPTPARIAPVVPPVAEAARRPASIEDTISGEGQLSVEAGDPLAEADFHMAYGLYDQAADLVQLAAKREPHRRDLKLKLLEIFFVWGNRDRFLALAREMHSNGADSAPGEWDKVRIMGRQIAPDDPLFAAGAAPVAAVAAGDLDMELHADTGTIDLDIGARTTAFSPDLDLTGENPQVSEDTGIDFILDEPLRGAEVTRSVATTIEAKRVKAAAAADEPTAEMSIEDLGIEVGDLQGLDDELFAPPAKAVVEDTVESPNLKQPPAGPAEPEEDLLSSTSILRREITATMPVARLDDATAQLEALEMTGELPTLETAMLPESSDGDTVDAAFAMDTEATTMSEVGTKLDLARAYIDMGDPEGARSILDEVLSEGSAVQKQEAERLIAGLP